MHYSLKSKIIFTRLFKLLIFGYCCIKRPSIKFCMAYLPDASKTVMGFLASFFGFASTTSKKTLS